TVCARHIMTLGAPASRLRRSALWTAVLLPFLFLAASNGLTDQFVYELHNDALAQLITIGGYWLVMRYAATNDRRLLVPMALAPVAGFLVKQNTAALLGFFVLQAAIFQRPRSLRRAAALLIVCLAVLGAVQAVALLLWGSNWMYWVITVLG